MPGVRENTIEYGTEVLRERYNTDAPGTNDSPDCNTADYYILRDIRLVFESRSNLRHRQGNEPQETNAHREQKAGSQPGLGPIPVNGGISSHLSGYRLAFSQSLLDCKPDLQAFVQTAGKWFYLFSSPRSCSFFLAFPDLEGLYPDRTHFELRYLRNGVESGVGQFVGGAFREMEGHGNGTPG
jgi:hypothetical protein